MRKTLLLAGCLAATALLFGGGIALGDALSDDSRPDAATADDGAAAGRPVVAATPIPIDASAEPGEAIGADLATSGPTPTDPSSSPPMRST